MRGFPLLNLLIALVLSGAALVPLVWRYTRGESSSPPPVQPDTTAADKVPAHVSLRFVHAPAKVRLTAGEVVLFEWLSPNGALLLEETVPLPLSGDRMAFGLQIEWPAGTPEANNVVLQVEPEGYQAWKDAIFCSGGMVDEIIEFNCQP